MFPQIAKKKKKEFVIDEIIIKQWEDALKDIQMRSKIALKRIPHAILQDYGKVCRIKSIPEFYANYFLVSTQKINLEQLSKVYAEQIQRLLTNNSHFHRINQALRQREDLIEGMRKSLIIVQGFMLMNQNKSVPLQIKFSIDDFVNQCTTLQQIKQLQKKKTEDLAKDIIRIRTNTSQLIELVNQWRKYLSQLSKSEGIKIHKAIYPYQAINCLLMTLYDLSFLKKSALKAQINFGKDQYDPFLQKLSKNKKGSHIQNYLIDYLKADTTDYNQLRDFIMQQLPNQQTERLRQKQIELQQKKEERAKQQRLKQQKIRQLREQKLEQAKVRHYSSVKSMKPVQKQQSRIVISKTSKGQRSERKIINVDKLLRQTSIKKSKQSIQKVNENQSKVLGAYKKIKKNIIIQNTILDQTQIIQEKKLLQRQMKEQKQEKQKIRKLLRQAEKKAMQQTKQFEQKLKRYQQQVQNLKSRAQKSKNIRLGSSRISKSPISPEKNNKIIIVNAYKSQSKGKDPKHQILQSKLNEQQKNKKNLQKQIKQLAKQKLKLQRIIQKQSLKTIKQQQVNKKKIQKYEQVINKLKNETEQSKSIIQGLEKSKFIEEKKQQQALKKSIIREKQLILKKDIEQKIQQKQKKAQQYQSLKMSPRKSRSKQIHSIYENNDQSKKSNKSKIDESKFASLQSRLQEQSRAKRSLQSQIREVTNEKLKLQRFIERQNAKSNKQDQKNNRRIQKYEQTISKLKQETEQSRRIINNLQSSKIAQENKYIEKSKIQLAQKREEQLKKKIQQKIQQRQKRKMIQRQKLQQSKINNQRRLSNSTEKRSLGSEDVEIIKTKQTIQIVFEPKRKKSHQTKQLLQAESKLARLQRERDLLQRKLQFSILEKKDKQKRNQVKSRQAEREQISSKFQQQIQKQRQKNYRLEQNIKNMRKNVSTQYELRLNKQKMKFEREKQELLRAIEKQRDQKKNKDKILEQQMIFLKEMEKKQNQLFQLLERQKHQKLKKQKILNKQIQEKQQLMSMIQFEQIKKSIERQVRKQIEQNDQQQQNSDLNLLKRKLDLQRQIEQLTLQKQNQLQQMNNQNEKLKDLISRIKEQQNQLLQAIKDNIDMQSQSDRENQPQIRQQINAKQSDIDQKANTTNFQNFQKSNQLLSKQLEKKTNIQFQQQQKQREKLNQITRSENYKQKQKIENLVQFYLNSAPDYSKPAKLQQFDKQKIVKQSTEKAKLIQKFQTQLFSLRDLPDFVPSMKNDSITNHLLNLREAYEDYEADSLRRQLFPPLEGQVYGDRSLSYQSQEQPIVTIMDDVRDHLKRHPLKKQDRGKKNFLAINRVRVAVLEDDRKQKQRLLIQQQSRKRIQKQLFDKRRKQRQQRLQRERERQEQLKNRKKQQIYNKQKGIIMKDKMLQQKKRQQKLKKKAQKQKNQELQIKQNKKYLPKNIFKKSNDKNRKSSQSKQQSRQSISKMKNSKESSNQSESQKSQSELEYQKEKHGKNKPITPIKQQQNQQSLLQQKQIEAEQQVQQFEKQLKNKQRQLLKQQIKFVQKQVRNFIDQQEKYQVYQQFISETQLQTRIQQLLDLSSLQIKNLNGNTTIKQDVRLYTSIAILIAKNSKGIQIGLAVFHKQFVEGQYVCDYIIAHSMENFLNLIFNFSRFLFSNDSYCQKIQFLFNLKSVTESKTLLHFLEFQKKCRRLGEVYIKAKAENERKYVLRRNLFQAKQQKIESDIAGINLNLRLFTCGSILKQINQGFSNQSQPKNSSYNIILAYYLSKKQQKLVRFRERAENDLIYRELLVTSLLFQKKQLEIKNFSLTQYGQNQISPLKSLQQKFDLREVDELDQMKMVLADKLASTTKRCTLQVGYQQINYLLFSPQQATTSIQSSNSSETGYFLSIIPKYKLMIIEAEQFLTMSSKNKELTAFFYIKHFIKNIVDVKKQKFERIYLPQIISNNKFHYPEISKKLNETIFLNENIQIGWRSNFMNSITFTPRHQDLVIQRPFIVALLSGVVERAVEGSPIFVEVIQ